MGTSFHLFMQNCFIQQGPTLTVKSNHSNFVFKLMSLPFFGYTKHNTLKFTSQTLSSEETLSTLKQSQGNKYFKPWLSTGMPYLIPWWHFHSRALTGLSSLHKQVCPAPKHSQSNLTAKKISEITDP